LGCTAVRLISASDAARDRHGMTVDRCSQAANERVLVDCREQLGATEFSAQWTTGRTLDLFDPWTRELKTRHGSTASRVVEASS
jgi:hypothetical protein